VRDTEEASLDVIGHLLAKDNLPDEGLVDQILLVMTGLVAIAALQVTSQGSEETINKLRSLVKPLKNKKLNKEAHTIARLELINRFVQSSDNLPLQLIGRALFQQLAPNLSNVLPYAAPNPSSFAPIADQLDAGLESRDPDAVTSAFKALYELNKDGMVKAFTEARKRLAQSNNKANTQ
jgi:DNA-binding FadR family transcriptional regulator